MRMWFAGMMVALWPGVGVQAETQVQASQRAALVAGAVCLVRTTTEEGKAGVPFRVMVAADEADALIAKGFSRIDCGVRDRRMANFKKQACEMAGWGNEAVQKRLETVLGYDPVKLCTSAVDRHRHRECRHDGCRAHPG